MLRFIAQLLCGLCVLVVTGIVVMLVLANREYITLDTTPFPYHIEMPLYLLMALCFLAGLGIGLILYSGLKLRTSLVTRKLRRQLATLPATKA